MMDYEKAYKAVLQTATQWIKDGCTDKERICLECVFPELRESEDERIRKDIINLIYWLKSNPSLCSQYYKDRYDDILAWLEKQKGNQFFVGYVKGYSEGQLNPKQKEQKPERINITEMVAKYRATDEYVEGEYKGKPVNCMIRAYEQGIRDTLSKVKEQKPAWNEEDESILNNIIAYRYLNIDDLEWIKKLPKRFNLQPKQEWSEEDEKKRKRVIKILEQANENWRTAQGSVPFGTLISWLKSLRPSWKPSKEQIAILWDAISNLKHDGYKHAEELVSLYEQLKKLS